MERYKIYWLFLFTTIFVKCSGINESIDTKWHDPLPPNILLIMTDDQGWGDLSFHGNEVIETPNLDQLAKESTRFNRFYVSPVCAPTRPACLLADTTSGLVHHGLLIEKR